FRGVETLPAPAREKRRYAVNVFDVGTRIDEHTEDIEILPPPCREQPAARRRVDVRSAIEQERDQVEASGTGSRFEQRGASVATVRLIDRETTIEQDTREPDLRVPRSPRRGGLDGAGEVQEVVTPFVDDSLERRVGVEDLDDAVDVEAFHG